MKKIHAFLLVASMLLTACGNGLQASDPAVPFEVAAGSEFEIVLESNPATGYHWELVDASNFNVVEFLSMEYKGDEPAMPGSGGLEVWTFKALSAGEAHILLGYYPPSNEPTDPQQTVTFTVTVK